MKLAGRLLLLALLLRWTLVFLLWPMREDVIGSTFIHLINLPFHEAGHIIFSPFGEFMTVLGGSLMQVLIPLVCMVAFLMETSFNPFGAAVMLWWTGENMLDVALYMNDARSLSLTLIGGHTGMEVEGHDWEHLLIMTNSLHLDHRIAWTTHVIGALMMIGALVWGAILAVRDKDQT